MKLSLRNRFLIPTLALLIAGMGMTTTISYVKSRAALKNEIVHQIGQITGSTAQIIDSWLQNRKLDVSSWAEQSLYQTALKDSFMGKAARKSANGQLAKLKQDYQYYENICLADTGGEIVAAADEAVIGTVNVADRDYFKESLAGKVSVSPVIQSKGTGNPVFVMSSPVSEGDKIAGVLFSVIDISVFSAKFVDPIKVGQTGYAYIYDADGTVIAHPDKAQILELNMNQFDFGREMIAEGEGLIEYSWNGVKKLVRFQKNDELGWTVGVGAATREMMAPALNLRTWNVAVALAVVAIGGLVILLVVQSTVKPINRMVEDLGQAGEQVAAGSGQVASSSQQLAEGASQQAASIEETSSSLEEMASMTKQNAANAEQAKRMMSEAEKLVENVSRQMDEMVTAIA